MNRLLILFTLLLPFFVEGQDSTQNVPRHRIDNSSILKISDRPIQYDDSTQSRLFTFFGRPISGPQYFLILKDDSTFTWDAWYGSDSYISSGRYKLEDDTLYILGDINRTEIFESAYKKAKPEWPWYRMINVSRKFLILEKDSITEQITTLKLIKEVTSKKSDWNRAYIRVTDFFFKKEDLDRLKELLIQMKEMDLDDETIKYTEIKIMILESN